MKILIDARMYGLEHAGIGRYVSSLTNHLQSVDKENHYLILLRKSQVGKFEIRNSKFEIKIVDIPHYSLQEQLELPKILSSLDFDITHFPHFNVPLFFKKPFVITIHDLIKHSSRGPATTTRTPMLYWLKYAGYKVVFGSAVTRAKKIIVPSNAIKDELLKRYRISPNKVVVIYEGVDGVFGKIPSIKYEVLSNKYEIKKPYVIYAGNAYPHKNLERLISAVKQLHINLVIVSARNVFTTRLIRYVNKIKADSFVNFLGFVPDDELEVLYKNAKAFVFPSLSEGFGLPGLEAMTSGCLVVCSDIPVFHEIYGDAATYFNPYNVGDIAQKIGEVLRFNESIHQIMIQKGKERAKLFSWSKMAECTLRVYKDTAKQIKLSYINA